MALSFNHLDEYEEISTRDILRFCAQGIIIGLLLLWLATSGVIDFMAYPIGLLIALAGLLMQKIVRTNGSKCIYIGRAAAGALLVLGGLYALEAPDSMAASAAGFVYILSIILQKVIRADEDILSFKEIFIYSLAGLLLIGILSRCGALFWLICPFALLNIVWGCFHFAVIYAATRDDYRLRAIIAGAHIGIAALIITRNLAAMFVCGTLGYLGNIIMPWFISESISIE